MSEDNDGFGLGPSDKDELISEVPVGEGPGVRESYTVVNHADFLSDDTVARPIIDEYITSLVAPADLFGDTAEIPVVYVADYSTQVDDLYPTGAIVVERRRVQRKAVLALACLAAFVGVALAAMSSLNSSHKTVVEVAKKPDATVMPDDDKRSSVSTAKRRVPRTTANEVEATVSTAAAIEPESTITTKQQKVGDSGSVDTTPDTTSDTTPDTTPDLPAFAAPVITGLNQYLCNPSQCSLGVGFARAVPPGGYKFSYSGAQVSGPECRRCVPNCANRQCNWLYVPDTHGTICIKVSVSLVSLRDDRTKQTKWSSKACFDV